MISTTFLDVLGQYQVSAHEPGCAELATSGVWYGMLLIIMLNKSKSFGVFKSDDFHRSSTSGFYVSGVVYSLRCRALDKVSDIPTMANSVT